jgi:hypothetical protein
MVEARIGWMAGTRETVKDAVGVKRVGVSSSPD